MFADPLVRQLADFVGDIGIDVRTEPLPDDTFLPGLLIRDGGLVVDQARLAHPGDMLHEAGHIAVCDAQARGAAELPEPSPADEMAALAWSWAALMHLGIAPEIVFHSEGYKGGADSLIEAFRAGPGPGTPMLVWYGMTNLEGDTVFPQMMRWLR